MWLFLACGIKRICEKANKLELRGRYLCPPSCGRYFSYVICVKGSTLLCSSLDHELLACVTMNEIFDASPVELTPIRRYKFARYPLLLAVQVLSFVLGVRISRSSTGKNRFYNRAVINGFLNSWRAWIRIAAFAFYVLFFFRLFAFFVWSKLST